MTWGFSAFSGCGVIDHATNSRANLLVGSGTTGRYAPYQPVILTVVKMKRLACNAAELMTLPSMLQKDGVQLELLSGPHRGVRPERGGVIVFAVLAVATEVEREGIRQKMLEVLDTAARKGSVGGRLLMDDDKLAVARARCGRGGESATAIARALGVHRASPAGTLPIAPETGAQAFPQLNHVLDVPGMR
ncbi:recombinase family protein [Streptomyces yaizuensis]|uniref:Resolvase/invertase-type recombinase catalytic domain-containing protein n=1 Tax=Streptomyces yaizuensis TaxID=2989713 RepID=A0ABQ5P6Y8_9ACTN|nr:recombinase family protein [Streptomyces sp. YSPA8]GLF98336.1 hypothetical protein SYYSPA8_28585 [Streptomyces sp. YSPA8]